MLSPVSAAASGGTLLQPTVSVASLQSPPHPPPHSSRKAPRDRDREKDQPHPGLGRSAPSSLRLEEDLLECRDAVARKDEYIAGLQRNCETLAALCASQ